MKTLLLATLAGLVAFSAAGQGQIIVNFNNLVYGCVRSPVYGTEPGNPILSRTGNTTTGTPPGTQTYGGLPLTGYDTNLAELFVAPGLQQEDFVLVSPAAPVSFRNPNAAGYVTPTNIVVPFLRPGDSATFQVRAWDNSSGKYPYWAVAESAWNAGIIAAGKSRMLYITSLQATPPAQPTELCGLLSFNIHYKPALPVITTQPTNQAVLAGQDATFSVIATGTQPLSYQWRFNSSPIVGATNSSCTITNAQLTNAGPYTVLVTNAYGSVTSTVVTLTVVLPGFVQLELIANPSAGGTIAANPLPVADGYTKGTVVALTAHPASGYQFAGWSGAAIGPTNPTTVTMDDAKSVTACFRGPAFNPFDTAAGAGSWITWPTWGLQFPIVWDATLDRAGAPGSGSLRWVVPFTGAADDQLMSLGTFANRWPWDDGIVLDGSRFTNFSFDLKVASGTASTILGNYGDFEIGLLHEGPTEWERIALPGFTLPVTNDWVHVVSPIDPAAPGIDAIVGMYIKLWSGGKFTNTFTFNVDNLLLEPAPSVPLSIERAGAALRLLWSGGALQHADTVSGPYSDLAGAASPWMVTPTDTAHFYRLKAPNLAQNPGFEAGTSGWFGLGGTLTIATNLFHAGARSGFVTNRTDTWNGVAQLVAGVLELGRSYRISAWARLAGGSPQPVLLTMKKTDTSGTSYQNVAAATASADGWTQLSGNYTLTVSGVLTELLLYLEGPPAGVSFYADDFVIEP